MARRTMRSKGVPDRERHVAGKSASELDQLQRRLRPATDGRARRGFSGE